MREGLRGDLVWFLEDIGDGVGWFWSNGSFAFWASDMQMALLKFDFVWFVSFRFISILVSDRRQ